MLQAKSSESEPITYPLALITGGAHRLGKAFAISLARQGYAIALHFNSSAIEASVTAEEIRSLGVPVFIFRADLSDETQIRSMFAGIDALFTQSDQRLSPLRVLVNSAAVMLRGDARAMKLAEFDAVININLRAPFLCAQLAYQRMDAGGLIVNISDIAAQKAWSGFPAYTVSKAGLDSLTKVLARSFAPKVRVNAISPGLVLISNDAASEDWARLVNSQPLQRAAKLEEITGALEFLLKNEYITGQSIVVDGGYSLR